MISTHAAPAMTRTISISVATGALIGLGSVAFAAAPSQAVTAPISLTSTKVFIEGDSLTVGAARALKSQLRHHVKSVRIDAQVGRHTGEGIRKLRSPAAKAAGIWVVALGTNDSPNSAQTRKNVTQVLRLAGKNRQVIWVNVVRPGGYGRVNRTLSQLDAANPQLTVIDWAAVIRKQRELLTGDRVHLTSKGYRIRAIATRNAILSLAQPTVD
jgi:hypothetical protein